MKETVNQRIKNLRKSLRMTQVEFSEAIGITQTTIARIENGYSHPSPTTLFNIATRFKVSLDWLEMGKGSLGHMESVDFGDHLPKPSDLPVIPLFHQKAYAGVLSGVSDVSDEVIGYLSLPNISRNVESIALQVSGESMYPTIKDRDIVVGLRQLDFSGIFIGAVYILCIKGEGTIIKRIESIHDDELILSSDNQGYSSYKIKKSDIQQLFRLALIVTGDIDININSSINMLQTEILELRSVLFDLKRRLNNN